MPTTIYLGDKTKTLGFKLCPCHFCLTCLFQYPMTDESYTITDMLLAGRVKESMGDNEAERQYEAPKKAWGEVWAVE